MADLEITQSFFLRPPFSFPRTNPPTSLILSCCPFGIFLYCSIVSAVYFVLDRRLTKSSYVISVQLNFLSILEFPIDTNILLYLLLFTLFLFHNPSDCNTCGRIRIPLPVASSHKFLLIFLVKRTFKSGSLKWKPLTPVRAYRHDLIYFFHRG